MSSIEIAYNFFFDNNDIIFLNSQRISFPYYKIIENILISL